MLWILPGAFVGNIPTPVASNFDGQQLAIRGVVVVTIDFRSLVFGYLCTDRPDAPGNVGQWDQTMALNWTQQYIRQFGGNPNDITLFGESSGSICVSANILSKVSNVYFNKAILESGTIFSNEIGSRSINTVIAQRFAKFMGCNPNMDYVGCLRNKSTAELIGGQVLANQWNVGQGVGIQLFNDLFPFSICYGDQYFPTNPLALLKARTFRPDLKVLSGHNIIEGAFVGLSINLVAFVGGLYVPTVPYALTSKQNAYNNLMTIFANMSFADSVAKSYTQTFTDWYNMLDTNALRATVVQALSDYRYVCPTVLFGQYLAQYSQFSVSVHQYYLQYANSKSMCYDSTWCYGAEHTDDVPPDAPGNAGLWDQAMAMNWTQQYITHFGFNPNDITIFGESAGAISVSAHILSNVSNGYFKKSIIQS
ncbi:unnamed protein product, partial [Medioppia subpectinata]